MNGFLAPEGADPAAEPAPAEASPEPAGAATCDAEVGPPPVAEEAAGEAAVEEVAESGGGDGRGGGELAQQDATDDATDALPAAVAVAAGGLNDADPTGAGAAACPVPDAPAGDAAGGCGGGVGGLARSSAAANMLDDDDDDSIAGGGEAICTGSQAGDAEATVLAPADLATSPSPLPASSGGDGDGEEEALSRPSAATPPGLIAPPGLQPPVGERPRGAFEFSWPRPPQIVPPGLGAPVAAAAGASWLAAGEPHSILAAAGGSKPLSAAVDWLAAAASGSAASEALPAPPAKTAPPAAAPTVPVDVPGGSPSASDGDAAGAQRRRHDDRAPLTEKSLEEVCHFLARRLKETHDKLGEEVLEKLGGAVCKSDDKGHDAGGAPAADLDLLLEETARSITMETSELIGFAAEVEKAAAAAVQHAVEVRSKEDVAEPVRRELTKWRDQGGLAKAVNRVVERQAFADQLVEGLARPNGQTELLHAALQPSKKEVQGVLKQDLEVACRAAAVSEIPKVLSKQGALKKGGAKAAIECAMKEMSVQTMAHLDDVLRGARKSLGAGDLAPLCAESIRSTVRNDVRGLEAAFAEAASAPAAPAGPTGPSLREQFSVRLGAAVAPLYTELSCVEDGIRSADQGLQRCSWMVQAVETAFGPGSDAGAAVAQANIVTATRGRAGAVVQLIDSGHIKEALVQALLSDAGGHPPSADGDAHEGCMVEVAVGALSSQAPGETELDLLARADVAAAMDGRLRLLLMDVLVGASLVPGKPASKLDSNLEWALGLLQSVSAEDEGLREVLNAKGAEMRASWGALLGLGGLPPDLRRRIEQRSKLALKCLDLLQRVVVC